MASGATVLQVPGPEGAVRDVRISSPDRVIWPTTNNTEETNGAVGTDRAEITKLQLAEYTVAVADAMMRALGDRPVTLQRFPQGTEGEEFFSKNPPRGVPDWARSVICTYPSARSHPQLVIDEIATAVWAVQMNTVTFHPWPVRSDNNDNPDELRIDLDPQPGTGFVEAVRAAYVLKDLMEEIGLTGWAKTSGNRGVHVYARVSPTHEFMDVRHGVIGIARELERRMPNEVTTAWWKEERGQKVFVDFNQANRDRTIASAYSPRPLPGAPVSMPVPWERLREVRPGDFTVRTVPAILAAEGDAWAGIDDSVGDVGQAIALWDRDVHERGLGEMPFPPDYPKMPGEPPRVQPSRQRRAPDVPRPGAAQNGR